MKTGFLIIARMKSTRLPRKVVLPVLGRGLIRWMIDRIKLAKEVDEIIMCTSTNTQDDLLSDIAAEEGIGCFRGHEEDVLLRKYNAAKEYSLDYVVTITADCPLVSVEYIDETVKVFKDNSYDLIRALDLPHGFFSYGMKPSALEKVCQIKKSEHTEVWGRYFTETGHFSVHDISIPKCYQRPEYRLTVDYPDDYNFFIRLFEHFGKEMYRIDFREILEYLDGNKDVVAINSGCKALFQKRNDEQSRLCI